MSDFPVKQKNGCGVQEAIDAAAAAGGGRVVLESGVYPCGTLYLKSHVELYLEPGAKLQGSSHSEDYDDVYDSSFDSVAPENSRKVLLAAVGCRDIAITGFGEINGAGPEFYDRNVPEGSFFSKPQHPRPRMVQFSGCRNIRIEGVSFVDSPGWTFWLLGCEDVRISGIRVEGCQQMINNDGIDIDDCRRVTVSDSFFRTGDDCLVLRAIRKTPEHHAICSEVVVTNCVLDSRCQAIRIGCPSDDTICDCTFSNLVVKGAGNGIHINNPKRYLSPGCGGYLYLDRILFSGITMECGGVPIWINVEEGVKLRHLGGITFSNLQINAAESCRLEGCPETWIEHIRFHDVVGVSRSSETFLARWCRGLVQEHTEWTSCPVS